jgi:hypothetical protein
MPDQPNPFVNPNSRDVQLPDGCKDLLEVLLKAPGKSGHAAGAFATLKIEVRLFYQSKLNAVLNVGIMKSDTCLLLSQVQGEFILTLAVRKEDRRLKDAFARLFGQQKVVSEISGHDLKVVDLRLPAWWEEAGQKIMELLIHGHGLTDPSRLWFHMQYSLG